MAVQKVNHAKFEEWASKGETVLLDFYAEWCGPCRMLAPIVEEVAAERPDVLVGKVNVDEEPALAARFGITSIPTLLLIRSGAVQARSVGLVPKEKIAALLG